MDTNSVENCPVPDPSYYHALLENPLNSLSQYLCSTAKSYEKSFIPRIAQSFCDTSNLFFSSCWSLAFSYKDAFTQSAGLLDPKSYDLAKREFHEFEITHNGSMLIFFSGFFLIVFALAANLYDKEKNPHWLLCWMNSILPYLRIVLKQVKWIFKGIRFIFTLCVLFGSQKELLIQLLFPIIFVATICSIANRLWLRYIRDDRKIMQDKNNNLSKKIFRRSGLVHELKEIPNESERSEYGCSLIFIKDDNNNPVELIYLNQSGTVKNISDTPEKIQVYYDAIQKIRIDKISKFMAHYLVYLTPKVEKKITIYFHPKAEKERLPDQYNNGDFVYLTDPGIAPGQRLIEIIKGTENAPTSAKIDSSSALFHHRLEQAMKQNELNSINLADIYANDNLQELSTTISNLPPPNDSEIYQSFMDFRKTNENALQKENIATSRCELLSAALGGLFDGLYFYMGTVTLAAFTPQIFMLLLGSSITLVLICIIVRIQEALMYQNRHRLSCIQPELALAKETFKMLLKLEFSLPRQNQSEPNNLDALIQYLGDLNPNASLFNSNKECPARARELLWLELVKENKKIQDLKQLQREIIRPNVMFAIGKGLYNGMAIQGVLSSVMLLTIMLYFGTMACPPLFVISFVGAGFVAIACCVAQSIYYHQHFETVFNQEEEEFNKEYQDSLARFQSDPKPADLRTFEVDNRLEENLDYLNYSTLNGYQEDMFAEWCEIGRLFFSGLSKGDKTSSELFYSCLNGTDAWLALRWPIMATGAIVYAFAFSFHYLIKTFASSQPNDTNTKSFTLFSKTNISMNKKERSGSGSYDNYGDTDLAMRSQEQLLRQSF